MLQKFSTLLVLLLSTCAFAQPQAGEIPRLIGGDIPTYPPIARAARLTGSMKVRVKVESGKVTKLDVLDAKGASGSQVLEHGSPLLIDPALSNLKSWRFNPSVNTSFDLIYTYKIDPALPENNAKIEISPLLNVTITTALLTLN